MIKNNRQPSGAELLDEIELYFGWKVRWDISQIIDDLIKSNTLTKIEKKLFYRYIRPGK
jgi:hypothetical protein